MGGQVPDGEADAAPRGGIGLAAMDQPDVINTPFFNLPNLSHEC